MTRKKPSAKKNTCTATLSGGALKCVLEGEHAVHSTSKQGRKASQYATWSLTDDGRIRVITYQRGKKTGEWFEDAPPAKNEELRVTDIRCKGCGAAPGVACPGNDTWPCMGRIAEFKHLKREGWHWQEVDPRDDGARKE